jgi:uncharacterized membrane-anchored protein
VPYRVKPKRAKSVGRLASGEMLVDVKAVNAFAREHTEKSKGKWMEVERLGGFCVLIKRALMLPSPSLGEGPGVRAAR